MALAIDATSGSNLYHNGTGSQVLSFSHTCSGNDRVLIVAAAARYDGGSPGISGITYGGIAMDEIGSSSDTSRVIKFFRLVNPATGANTIAITFTRGSGTGEMFMCGIGVSFTDADQTTPVENFNSAIGTSTTPSVSINSNAVDIVIDAYGYSMGGDADATVGAGQTSRGIQNSGANGTQPARRLQLGVSTEIGAGSVSMDWTLATSNPWNHLGVSVRDKIRPSAGGAALLPLVEEQR